MKDCMEKLREAEEREGEATWSRSRLIESAAAGGGRNTRSCWSGGACVWCHSNSIHCLIQASTQEPLNYSHIGCCICTEDKAHGHGRGTHSRWQEDDVTPQTQYRQSAEAQRRVNVTRGHGEREDVWDERIQQVELQTSENNHSIITEVIWEQSPGGCELPLIYTISCSSEIDLLDM